MHEVSEVSRMNGSDLCETCHRDKLGTWWHSDIDSRHPLQLPYHFHSVENDEVPQRRSILSSGPSMANRSGPSMANRCRFLSMVYDRSASHYGRAMRVSCPIAMGRVMTELISHRRGYPSTIKIACSRRSSIAIICPYSTHYTGMGLRPESGPSPSPAAS